MDDAEDAETAADAVPSIENAQALADCQGAVIRARAEVARWEAAEIARARQ